MAPQPLCPPWEPTALPRCSLSTWNSSLGSSQTAAWGLLPPPVPWNLGQSISEYFPQAWPGPPGSSHSCLRTGPGAKEVGRAGSPLPVGPLPTSVVLPREQWPRAVLVGLSLTTSVFPRACPQPCPQGASCLLRAGQGLPSVSGRQRASLGGWGMEYGELVPSWEHASWDMCPYCPQGSLHACPLLLPHGLSPLAALNVIGHV